MPKEVVSEARRKKAKLATIPKEKRPYHCKHCTAEFATNQALGGHAAGHHREKKVPTRLSGPSGVTAGSQNGKRKVEDEEDYDDMDLSRRRGRPVSVEISMARDVPWQSGQQAAGRQVRQHSEKRNDGRPPAAAVAATPTAASADDGGGRRLWNIDLNVEAPEQE